MLLDMLLNNVAGDSGKIVSIRTSNQFWNTVFLVNREQAHGSYLIQVNVIFQFYRVKLLRGGLLVTL